MLRQIVYVSTSTIPPDMAGKVVHDMCGSARSRNQTLGITGVLFHENNHFMQAIEGEPDSISEVFESISKDPRHCNIDKLMDEPIKARAFSEWNMDSFLVDSNLVVTDNMIRSLISIYRDCMAGSSASMVDFIRKVLDEIDTYAIMNEIKAERRMPQRLDGQSLIRPGPLGS